MGGGGVCGDLVSCAFRGAFIFAFVIKMILNLNKITSASFVGL